MNKKRAYTANLSRLKKNHQVPLWADLKAIKDFYLKCPDGYVVDHILPLNGKFISGLHVLENLQYLTASENSSKCNFFGDHQIGTHTKDRKLILRDSYIKHRECRKNAALIRYHNTKLLKES